MIKQYLNPIFRPRVPKLYFPAPEPFKTGRGRVEMHLGLICIEFVGGMGKPLFNRLFASLSGTTHFGKTHPNGSLTIIFDLQ